VVAGVLVLYLYEVPLGTNFTNEIKIIESFLNDWNSEQTLLT